MQPDFFFGLVNGQDMDVCGKIGAITAGHIVEVIGAKMEESKWQTVRRLVNEFVL